VRTGRVLTTPDRHLNRTPTERSFDPRRYIKLGIRVARLSSQAELQCCDTAALVVPCGGPRLRLLLAARGAGSKPSYLSIAMMIMIAGTGHEDHQQG
jgi:hypothetical protein